MRKLTSGENNGGEEDPELWKAGAELLDGLRGGLWAEGLRAEEDEGDVFVFVVVLAWCADHFLSLARRCWARFRTTGGILRFFFLLFLGIVRNVRLNEARR